MSKKALQFRLLSLILLAALLLSACSTPATPTAAPTEAPVSSAPASQPAPTNPPAPTAVAATATAVPTEVVRTPGELLMATTTSTQDSGLLDYLLPVFTQETGIQVKVIAVGSGQALQMGKDGNADVLLVHSPAAEKTFMDNKDGVRREDVMYNDFVIVGPASDPAKISGIKSASDAFKALAAASATFISRGDNSGTYTKETSIWKAAGIEPKGDWYISAGQGMGAVLTMADEKQAYTLSDRATYLTQTQKGLTLKVLVEGDKLLLNPYGVIAVNPDKSPKIQYDLAIKFIDWIISVPVQQKIADFKKADFGMSIFNPSSKPWLDAQGAASPTTSAPAADLAITGKVAAPQAWKEADVKAMPTMESQATNKQGVMSTYTGVSLKALLDQAKPAADAATQVFVASDGFTAEMALSDAMACAKCIVSFRDQGGFSLVAPDFPSKLQVKGLVEIQVK